MKTGPCATLMTDVDGQHHLLGIPPHKVAPAHVAAMRDAAHRLLAPQFAEILDKTAQPFLQPIYDVASPRLVFDRIALMGDAAFVARPHVGMGVTKAAEDAMALSDAMRMREGTPAALVEYEARRLIAGHNVVERGRQLGAYMQAQGRAGADNEVVRDAHAVLRETAIDLERHDRPVSEPTAAILEPV